ncbi:MAG: hypothetical protein D6820_18615, partial [Lentisphaerae bacterium]
MLQEDLAISRQKTKQLRVGCAVSDNLRDNLVAGNFSILFGCDIPPENEPFLRVMEPWGELAQLVRGEKRVCGMLISRGMVSGQKSHACLRSLEFLRKCTRKKELGVITAVHDQWWDELAAADAQSLPGSFVWSSREERAEPEWMAGERDCCPDEAANLSPVWLNPVQDHVLQGVECNPYVYHPAAVMMEYHKMVQAISAGADMIVLLPGWDLRKIQEVQWYLMSRNLYLPVLARMRFLWEKDVSRIIQGEWKRVGWLPREAGVMIQRAYGESRQKGIEVVLKWLAYLVAGLRLFGYSGVILDGFIPHHLAEQFLGILFPVFQETKDLGSLLERWEKLWKPLNLNPYPQQGFTLYRNLLNPEVGIDFDPEFAGIEEFPRDTEQKSLFSRWQQVFLARSRRSRNQNTEKELLKKLGIAQACPRGYKRHICDFVKAEDGCCDLTGEECVFC